MANKEYLDIAPSYPLSEIENWRVLVAEMESGAEQRAARWTYPRREWDLVWNAANRSTETDPLRNFLNKVKGAGESFLWREPTMTSRDRVEIGTGNGTLRSWLMPVTNWAFLTVRVGATDKFEGPDYEILPAAGQNGLDLILFAAAPAANQPIECDYADGFYVPIVRAKGNFQTKLIKGGGYDRSNMNITLYETRGER